MGDEREREPQYLGVREVIRTGAGEVNVYGMREDDETRYRVELPDELLSQGDLLKLAVHLRAVAMRREETPAVP